jgi:peptidoglycan/xylan/chitin deacetylase (PgdA/CDA1 family)
VSIILNFKNLIKTGLKTVVGSRLFFDLAKFLSRYNKRPNLLSVTYHDTPYSEMMNFRKQMSWYKSEFDDCNLEELKCFLDEGVWGKSKPGIIITFDDGLASNYIYASKILDEFGFTGWFMVPAGIIDLPIHDHLAFAHDGP